MKQLRILFLLSVMGMSTVALASGPFTLTRFAKNPTRLRIGAIGLYNTNYVYNRNIQLDKNQKAELDSEINAGLTAGIFFTERFGIKANLIFGKFSPNIQTAFDSITVQSGFEYNKIDVPILLHFGKTFYTEIGPQVTFVGKADHNIQDGINTNDFSSSYFSAVYGNGFRVKMGRIGLHAGGRITVGLTDIEGTDGYGNDLSDNSIYEDGSTTLITGTASSSDAYDKYRKSFPVSFGIVAGLTFSI